MSKYLIAITLFISLITGCFNTDHCLNGYYQTDIGDCNGKGVCVKMPATCTTEYVPVCGCDGYSYENSCEAASKGINIRYTGRCN